CSVPSIVSRLSLMISDSGHRASARAVLRDDPQPVVAAGRPRTQHRRVSKMTSAEQLTAPITEHGEGPVWWPDGHLRCVDLLAGDLVDVYDDGTITRTRISDVAAVVRPRSAGGAVVAVERGIVLLDAAGNATRRPEVWSDPGVRMNDGGC